MRHCLLTTFLPVLACLAMSAAPAQHTKKASRYNGYLFVYFTGNTGEEESIRFAVSNDGYHYRALNGNKPVLSSAKISSTGGVRDPHILRGADGKTFYMVVTDMVSAKGWSSNRAMVLLKSTDLLNWTSAVVNIQQSFPGQDSLLRVWAPQTIYDARARKYMIYFSMKHGNEPDKIYYAYANTDFTGLEGVPKQLFYHPTNGACIDGDIIFRNGKYHLFFKTEGGGAGIKVAVSDSLTGSYTLRDKYVQQTSEAVEGSAVFPLNDGSGYILMYDVYMKGAYQFTRSTDLEHFRAIDEAISMNFHPRHGTVLPITGAEYERLVQRWLPYEDVLLTAGNPGIKERNIVYDSAMRLLTLPVKPGTNLRTFDPGFMRIPGVQITRGRGAFHKERVPYTLRIKGRSPQTYAVTAIPTKNPILDGYYADPEILYSQKTGKYYCYPTSDGFNNWSGTYFKVFSSSDLQQWKDEGVMLDLTKDVNWAKRNAWAPCIIEKKIDGQYKYFYYFTAAQKIGVAVADHPTGPFRDMGKPLIDKHPPGINRGQVIDPDVFTDPQTGKSYLYWGNGFMAGAELNENMTSLKENTMTLLQPGPTFREGTEVFFRNGRYYFSWSENDTRDPDYRVRYGIADSPLGAIRLPEQNLVLSRDDSRKIYGTGHHAILHVPGKDEWYIIYHRFTYPQGITMGRAAGFHREVCIDPIRFNEDGSLLPVQPTH